MSANPFRIMGIDPGANCAGYVVLESKKNTPFFPKDFRILDAGAIKTRSTMSHSEKIGAIHEAIFDIATEWHPHVGVIERAFMGVNINSALRIGEARGALITSLRRLNIPVAEVTPAKVKKVIAGNGQASKEMVYLALKTQMQFDLGKLPLDVSDAVAIGICYGITEYGVLIK